MSFNLNAFYYVFATGWRNFFCRVQKIYKRWETLH